MLQLRPGATKKKNPNKYLNFKRGKGGLLWWPGGWDSALPMQGTQIQSLVRELDPTHCN